MGCARDRGPAANQAGGGLKLRNKAPTWYREGKLVIGPGETITISDHDGRELINRFSWHFEAVKEKKPERKEDLAREF